MRPLELIRLPSLPPYNEPMVVSIFESPGRNYLADLVDFGQTWLRGRNERTLAKSEPSTSPRDQVSLLTFLDFAVGATECMELLHHGLRVVHGELRADAFHFSQHTRVVKLVNFGSGSRAFENGLTSAGWSKLSRELGIKNKLQFIAPEQTGRLSGNPDSRSDIYSLGVLLWTMLIGEPAFDGDAPIDVIQAVLNRRLPSVSSRRMDVPDVLSNIIQKMTSKQIDERYSSTSGLKHDFAELQRILAEGDGEALLNFQLGSKDVSSIFMLPIGTYGRGEEHEKIVAVIDKVAKVEPVSLDRNGASGMYSVVSGSASTISGKFDNLEEGVRSSSVSSYSQARNINANPVVNTHGTYWPSPSDASEKEDSNNPSIEKPALETTDSRDSIETTFSVNSYASTAGPSASQRTGQIALPNRSRAGRRYQKRSHCEVVIVSGSAGIGKSSLLQSIQSDVRSRSGYSAITKFERDKSNPFESIFRSVGSLFRQIFSESDINSDYHNFIRRQLRPIWPSLCSMLDLPVDLISSEALEAEKPSRFAANSLLSHDSSSKHSGRNGNGSTNIGLLSTTEATRTNSTSKSFRIVSSIAEVLRVLSTNRLICLCLDDLQYAEGESLELLSSVVARKLGLVLIISCRDEHSLPSNIKSALDVRGINITRVPIAPLVEKEIIDYVAATLHREKGYVSSLAMVSGL